MRYCSSSRRTLSMASWLFCFHASTWKACMKSAWVAATALRSSPWRCCSCASCARRGSYFRSSSTKSASWSELVIICGSMLSAFFASFSLSSSSIRSSDTWSRSLSWDLRRWATVGAEVSSMSTIGGCSGGSIEPTLSGCSCDTGPAASITRISRVLSLASAAWMDCRYCSSRSLRGAVSVELAGRVHSSLKRSRISWSSSSSSARMRRAPSSSSSVAARKSLICMIMDCSTAAPPPFSSKSRSWHLRVSGSW
mmetsp:Transcript_31887/g.69640  ORF Transcript_31887/g.69640 Transcript_31887/m.69640 type:complete len:253 (-) Transcript_31887:1276-2034(-)